MARILAVYGTSHGHTAKVVDHIARALIARGHSVTVRPATEVSGIIPADFEAFLVAGSVVYGKHQRELRDFVRRNAALFNARPSAFLSVCGALMGSWPKGPAEAAKYLAEFLSLTGWHPALTLSVAGALAYTKYGFADRLVMRLISHFIGRPTDTSRDWEFTDWNRVTEFAEAFASRIEPGNSSGGSLTASRAPQSSASG